MDKSIGNTHLLDMAFTSPNLAKRDIQFQKGDNLGSDHLPLKSQLMLHHIEIYLLTTPSTNLTRLTEKYSNQHSRLR